MVSSSGTYVPLANFDSSNGVSGRTIGIIVGSILGALAVGILAFFLIRRRNRTNQLVTGNEKVVNRSPNILNPGTMGTATSGQTANSANPLVSARGFPNQSTTSLSGSAPRGFDGQTSGLTENEAKLIAETYRKSLRKPGWDDEEPHGQSTSSSGLL
ncbi:hypothetical protein K493DRAFT_11561 [Basidiobolus meristosporus CBS 931.73]|uniref:Uncharacterized protein n=1 Tax=Basidiobolus meristosporus CBS 931.73 TaxID=1314790 RepID=A0A1Y1YJB3_9FUNG|nr:hypothetical protein K493DRAFT_11561 [Basidiobolus meristosporus CBS 931.73]|eukprot:ORX97836.1 hypothetical protein K493DRAFT_11561 [Basidiobolus meristosporus CBS 931.73]